MEIIVEVDARKQTVQGEELWNLLKSGGKALIASGGKVEDISLQDCIKEEALAKLTGRTGNLRAPALRTGNIFYIGYSDALYKQLVVREYSGQV